MSSNRTSTSTSTTIDPNPVVGSSNYDEDEEYPYPWQILWLTLCLFTLGFPAKYRERLTYFRDLVPDVDAQGQKILPWTSQKTFSDRGEEKGGQKTMRQKQQEEWDRLNIAMSVITATSAAALAIQAAGPSPNQVYWLVTAFYSAAFGMSLQGLIMITYITISAGGASDEAIGRLARGDMFDKQPRWPVAFMMALPAILATYSSFALLAGLVAMIVQGPGESVATKTRPYIALAVVPVATTFLGLIFVIGLCEFGTYLEGRERKRAKQPQQAKPASIDQEKKRPSLIQLLSLSYYRKSTNLPGPGSSRDPPTVTP
ncbi:hypothetical protein FRC07_002936 [Ceratobasidium sp. 392]|nr:hypothetical protein FRC07_002936 [Ceratobasidium sp. 392]